ARSAYLRYREALGEEVGTIHERLYPGEYLIATGRLLAERDGGRSRSLAGAEWLAPVRNFAIAHMMDLIRGDFAAFGVAFDTFVSERALVESGAVEECLSALAERGLIYVGVLDPPKGKPPPDDWEPRPLTLFRATQFGDDVDRPVKRSD